MARVKVPGKKKADIMLFALSTCVWCGKTKKLLDDMGLTSCRVKNAKRR
jgi:glutaredoxin-like protein NrdH